ncbi:MAG TPA: alpha/beta hydrolase [Thermoleophilaceae bacterium]|nr:alpha/beta hydrolase [Thermoleophilaceae bacterium]
MADRRILAVNGVALCAETFGDPSTPPVVLLGGATSSMDWWRDEFCERLAAGGRFVVRYDQRDTGGSTTSPAGSPDYTADDLLADIVGVLDALELERAHVVGVSMGGGMAQWLALEHPERIASLTLIATSSGPGGPDDPDLPPSEPRVAELFKNPPPPPDWGNREQVIDHLVEDHRPYAGPLGFDADEVRAIAGTVFDRSRDIEASMTNHWLIEGGGGPLRPRLGEIHARTLVMHGTADPMFPLPHGEALAREIANARLVVIDGMGHEYPPRPAWDVVIDELLRHTA